MCAIKEMPSNSLMFSINIVFNLRYVILYAMARVDSCARYYFNIMI